MRFGSTLVQILVCVVLIGALFGAIAWRFGLAHRLRTLLVSWALMAVALGSLGAWRATVVQQQLGGHRGLDARFVERGIRSCAWTRLAVFVVGRAVCHSSWRHSERSEESLTSR